MNNRSYRIINNFLIFQTYRTLQEIPVIGIKIYIQFEGHRILVPYTKRAERTWVDVPLEKELTLILHLERENAFPKDMRVYAPKFSKVNISNPSFITQLVLESQCGFVFDYLGQGRRLVYSFG